MKAIPTQLAGPLILEPQVFGDDRGFFLESWNEKTFKSVTGLPMRFVQDNHSRSACGVLRGLHFQRRIPQGKLVRVTSGSVWMLPLTFALIPRALVNMSPVSSVRRIIVNCGFHRVSPMVFWCFPNRRISSTKRPLIGCLSMSEAFCGTTRRLVSNGHLIALKASSLGLPPKMPRPKPWLNSSKVATYFA